MNVDNTIRIITIRSKHLEFVLAEQNIIFRQLAVQQPVELEKRFREAKKDPKTNEKIPFCVLKNFCILSAFIMILFLSSSSTYTFCRTTPPPSVEFLPENRHNCSKMKYQNVATCLEKTSHSLICEYVSFILCPSIYLSGKIQFNFYCIVITFPYDKYYDGYQSTNIFL